MNKYILGLLAFPKTVIFNFRYFKPSIAIHLPVIVSHRVRFQKMGGLVEVQPKFGFVRIGFSENRGFDNKLTHAVWHNEGNIIFHGKAKFGNGTRIAVTGTLEVGDNVTFSGNSQIVCGATTKIGDSSLIGWDVLLLDYDAHEVKYEGKIEKRSEITIGSHVFICARSTILKGVNIADGSVIASNSNVVKSCDRDNSLYGGNPAKLIKNNITWST